jgi:tetratricopeptide (TPR) repeat protein
MPTIAGVSAIGGAAITGALYAAPGGSTSRTSSSSTSLFGPAFLLGGGASSTGIAAGLYNVLGSALGGLTNGAAAGRATYLSAADEERRAALESAAAKIDAGDTAGGRAEALALLDTNPRDPAALSAVAHSYLKEQDYKEAERYYARALAFLPTNASLQSSLRNARTLQRSDDEVLAEAKRRLASPQTQTDGLRLLFYLTERSPDHVEAYLAMADGFRAARKPLQVLGSLQEALAAADDADEVNGVITRAKAFVERHGQVGLGHNVLGRALVKAGRADEAIRALKIATERAPDNVAYADDLASAYVARADDHVQAGRMSSARADLDTAFAINPSDSGYREVDARLSLAQAEKEMAGYRYSRALIQLNRAYCAVPDDESFTKRLSASYVRLARYYHNKGDENIAREAYKKAYELDSGSTAARRYAAQLSHEKGLDYLSKTIHVKAIEHLEYAYQAERANATYKLDLSRAYHQYGLELLRQDKLNEGIRHLEKAFALAPTNSELGTDLSEALRQRDAA